MPFLLFLLLLPGSALSAQQMKAIQSSVKAMHGSFASLAEEVAQKMPYVQNAAKTSTYSFDGTDGRTGLTLTVTYRYKINNAAFTNTFTYAPDEANYYLTYLNGLQFFQDASGLSYTVVPLKKGGEKSYLWHAKDKTAILVPSSGQGGSRGFFVKIHFPKDISGENIIVEDISSRIDWVSLSKLFAP